MCFSANPKIAANEEPRSIAAGKRRMRVTRSMSSLIFQSTPPWGERPVGVDREVVLLTISIHAPRGGSDMIYSQPSRIPFYFNPRSPWGERLYPLSPPRGASVFQSTLPVGGATESAGTRFLLPAISIHAPRGGSDWCSYSL